MYTQVGTADIRTVTKAQQKRIAVEMYRGNPFAELSGSGKDMPIIEIDDLSKQAGETVRVYFGAKLIEDGTYGDDLLVGSEEMIRDYHQNVSIKQIRKATAIDGLMTEQRSQVEFRTRAADLLSGWTRDINVEFMVYHLSGARGVRPRGGGLILPTTFAGFAGNTLLAPDANHWMIADATGTPVKTQLTSTATMKRSVLEVARTRISLLGNTSRPLRPIVSGKRRFYAAFMTPEQINDLRQDPKWEDAQMLANTRGEENPIFSGAEGVMAGFVIYELPHGVLFSDYGSGGNLGAARCLILGAGALGIAYGKGLRNARTEERWFYVERQDDYENKSGFAVGCIYGMQKLRFNSEDHGVFTIDTAYTAVA